MQCITTYMGTYMHVHEVEVNLCVKLCTYMYTYIHNGMYIKHYHINIFVINFQHSNLIADHNNISFEPTMTSITTVTCTQIVYKMMSFAFSLVISIIQK